MLKEKNYDFIARVHEVHKKNRRDTSIAPAAKETVIDESWAITVPADAAEIVNRAASDLQDYLRVSMNVGLPVRTASAPAAKQIFLSAGKNMNLKADSWMFRVGDGVSVEGTSDRSVLRAVVDLEDRMNLREAPYLTKGDFVREPLNRLRSVHSSVGIDEFPDEELNAIVHAGFTAIDLFTRGIDTTAMGHNNISEIIRRAHKYGLDVILYNYIHCYVHPDDPDAVAKFDSVYGELIRHYPTVKAVSLVGESIEFPSKDPATSGKAWKESVVDGIPDTKPSPGWYPCNDYPAFIARIRDAIHAVNPDVEVIFSTYNWGWAPLEVRKKFLENFPKGVTLQITYEIFKQNKVGDLHTPVMDYTVSAAEPGFYFMSEAETAHSLGIPLRVTSNLAGATWDFGTVPYVPVPQRWLKRILTMRDWLKKCGIYSFYENHHYGWWPNPAIDLTKAALYSPEADEATLQNLLHQLAVRDYGKNAAEKIVRAWSIWSNSMDYYVASNEDQYGPWRVGSSYPFIFQPNISRTMARKDIAFPASPHAHFGGSIVKTFYMPYENCNQTPGPLRYPKDIERLEKMLEMWEQGLALVRDALAEMPAGFKHDNGERLEALGHFIRNSIRTTLGMKHWWLLNTKMLAQSERKPMLEILEEIRKLALAEIENVKDVIPAVETDSRIGWEPSMLYMTDRWHLEWKLRQLNNAIAEIDSYRDMIQFA